MKVLVFGATGKTGGLVVDRALEKGHEVSVLVRDKSKYGRQGVHVFSGSATNPGDVLKAIEGQEAVIDTIGGTTPYKSTTLETDAAKAAISALKSVGGRRLIVVSMLGIGTSRAQAPWWYKFLLMPTFLRGSTRDKTNMEQAVAASGLDYVIVRPPILKDGAALGSVIELPTDQIGHKITRADLAAYLVDQLTLGSAINRTVTVVNS